MENIRKEGTNDLERRETEKIQEHGGSSFICSPCLRLLARPQPHLVAPYSLRHIEAKLSTNVETRPRICMGGTILSLDLEVLYMG